MECEGGQKGLARQRHQVGHRLLLVKYLLCLLYVRGKDGAVAQKGLDWRRPVQIATSSDRVVDQLNLGFSSSQNTFGGKSQQTLFYFESIFGVILPSEGNPYQHGAFCLELMRMIEPLRLLMFKYDDCHDNV